MNNMGVRAGALHGGQVHDVFLYLPGFGVIVTGVGYPLGNSLFFDGDRNENVSGKSIFPKSNQ
ncbi:MAG: hypothetical protein CR994_05430 [Maribacter sp.]|nr:MAG: hypothetical protein CR994_05430 [Maribacter sp.]